jgi:ribosomal protein S18 acetylase RimI-like enzyme
LKCRLWNEDYNNKKIKAYKYICIVEASLNNPVYHALSSNNAHLGYGTADVKFFNEQVSPFVGFREDYDKGFDELYRLLPPGRKILYATRQFVKEPRGWELLVEIKGLQFVFDGTSASADFSKLVPLHTENVEEMVQLAALTKPGPFSTRTIEFGNYFGIFENGQLAAMAGQRLHLPGLTEISAVCTHPNHLGKGFAGLLLQHQIQLICKEGQRPFLHVREDNSRAIALYERLGFTESGNMNFYFLQRRQ